MMSRTERARRDEHVNVKVSISLIEMDQPTTRAMRYQTNVLILTNRKNKYCLATSFSMNYSRKCIFLAFSSYQFLYLSQCYGYHYTQ